MSYINLANFKYGLDGRRSELSSIAGTLLQINNAHITEGGQIEKRKAFVDVQVPSATYGIQETPTSVVVFGSRNVKAYNGTTTTMSGTQEVTILIGPSDAFEPAVGDPITVTGSGNVDINGTWVVTGWTPSGANDGAGLVSFFVLVTGTYFAAEATVITPYFAVPITYQQLSHPLGSSVVLVSVIASTLFGDKVFIITKWSNGDVLEFYNSELVTDFYIGSQSNITPTPYSIANSLIDQAIASGKYTGIRPVLPSALSFQVTGGSVSPGVNYVATVGYFFNRQVTLNNGIGAVTSDTFFVLSPPVDWVTSNNATAAAVAASINANAGGANPYGFVAANPSTNIVTLLPPTTDYYGNPLTISDYDTIQVTVGGNVTIFTPTNQAVFDILSIPDQNSPNPYSVSTTETNANLDSKLVSNGIAATLPTNAAGQFTVTAVMVNTSGTGTLTISGSGPLNNDTVTVGTDVYTFVTKLFNSPRLILIGSNNAQTLGNWVAAVNGAAGIGVKYSNGTVVSEFISAGALSGSATTVTAARNGTPGNIAVSESSSGLAWSGLTAGHLTGGTDVNQVTQISVGAINLLSSIVPVNLGIVHTANDLVAAINSFTGTSGFSATANSNVVTIIDATGGTTNNNALVTVTVAGGVCINNAHFAIAIEASTPRNITSITADAVTITGGTVTYTTTVDSFLAALVANVNTRQGVLGIATGWAAAYSPGKNLIWLSPATTTSNDISAVVVTVNSTNITVAPDTTGTALTATTDQNIVIFSLIGSQATGYKQSINPPGSALVKVSGGIPPYSYSWQNKGISVHNAVPQLSGQPNNWWKVFATKTGAPTGVEYWTCVVKDVFGNAVSVAFTLSY